jgi:hydrogenase maturation protease
MANVQGDPAGTIVVGLGNPVLGDDGVGWRVADEVERRLAAGRNGSQPGGVVVERLGVGGIRLMEVISDYAVAILIDAAEFDGRPAGEVRSCPLEALELHAGGHLDSIHDASLATALDLGRQMGAAIPSRIEVVTVQARSTDEFSEELSPEVEAAIPAAAAAVMKLLATSR